MTLTIICRFGNSSGIAERTVKAALVRIYGDREEKLAQENDIK